MYGDDVFELGDGYVELTAGRTALGVHWQQRPWTAPRM